MIHGIGVKIGFLLDTVVANYFMSIYCKYGKFRESLKLFDEMPERSAGSWKHNGLPWEIQVVNKLLNFATSTQLVPFFYLSLFVIYVCVYI